MLAIEASRLARNGRDWHTLLEFCGLVGCLLIDEDGVYDPRLVNDRLLLGMKGTFSELELSILRQRSQEAPGRPRRYRSHAHRRASWSRLLRKAARAGLGSFAYGLTGDLGPESIRAYRFQFSLSKFLFMGIVRRLLSWSEAR